MSENVGARRPAPKPGTEPHAVYRHATDPSYGTCSLRADEPEPCPICPPPAVISSSLESDRSRFRVGVYGAFTALTVAALVAGRSLNGSHDLDILMETVAACTAFVIGIFALVRFQSRKDYSPGSLPCLMFLYVAVAFLATGLLDAYHVYASFGNLPHEVASQVSESSWSWLVSRSTLAFMLALGLVWDERSRLPSEAARRRERRLYVFLGILVSVGSVVMSVTAPPALDRRLGVLASPLDALPMVLFALTLAAYARRGNWRRQPFEHWLVVSLLLATIGQASAALGIGHTSGTAHVVSHLVKIASYLAVLVGLLQSMFMVFKQSKEVATRLDESWQQLAEQAHELKRARDGAIQATEAKSTFLAKMSHEIRTPLHGMLGMSQLLMDTPLTDEQRNFVETGRDSAESLLTLVNGLLDLAKVEAGKLELDEVAFDPMQLIDHVAWQLATLDSAVGLDITSDPVGPVPGGVVGDPTRLRQILLNLGANAVKFTSRGTIRIGVEVEQEGDEIIDLHFWVADTGIGIPADRIDAIFESFEQVDASVTRRFGGTGLGLSIVSNLVKEMGGTVWVESQLGVGSTFHFTARFRAGQELPVEAAAPAAGGNLDVLLIACGTTPVHKVRDAASVAGWNLEVVHHEQAAVASMANAAQPPVVIVDAGIKDGDTEPLIRTLVPGAAAVVLLAPSGRPGDASRLHEAGLSGYLVGPVIQLDLLESVAEVVEGSGRLVTRHSLRERRPSRRVLLAEDSATNRLIVTRGLRSLGYDIATVENGRLAVEAFEKDDFDLILMDIQMPELDGISASEEIRALEVGRGTRTPIIALTAHAMEGDELRFRAAGIDAVVTKPFNLDRLITAMGEMLTRHDASIDAPRV